MTGVWGCSEFSGTSVETNVAIVAMATAATTTT